MENDYKNLMDEKEYERRFLLHQRFRKVLLIINLLFAIYLVIQLVKVCYREVDNKDKEPSYSLIINDLMNEGEKPYKLRSTPIRDFIVYGDNLSLFYYDYDVTGTNDYYVKEKAKFTFKNLDNNKTYTYRTSLYLDENIYLSSLSVGTYVVFYQEDDILDDMIVTHEAYNKNNEYVLYSLPYKVKDKIMHKKIVIGAIYSNSFPILSIKVSEEKMLSNETFDIAINYDENSKCNSVANKLKEKFKELNINVYLNKENTSSSSKVSFYNFIYDNDIRFAINLTNEKDSNEMKYVHSIKTKGYLNETVEKISSSVEENGILLDKNLFIRELGGRSTGTGICKADSSSLSCSMGDRKNEMGVSAISVSIGNLSDESMLNYYVNMIYSSFVQKYLR